MVRRFAKDIDFAHRRRWPGRNATLASRLRLLASSPGAWMMLIHRSSHWLYLRRAAGGPRSWPWHMLAAALAPPKWATLALTKSDIDNNVRIDPGVCFSDQGNIIFGAKSTGAGTVIGPRVTVGRRLADAAHPVIGRNVWIGPDCVIYGAITIGEGATLLPGTVLTKSIPPRVVVHGNPARVLLRDFDNTLLRERPEPDALRHALEIAGGMPAPPRKNTYPACEILPGTHPGTPDAAGYEQLLTEIERFWQPLPDKPEETPHSLLNALWHLASGVALSAEQARKTPLPPLDSDARQRLRDLIDLKKSGVPLAHLTERQHFLGLEFLAGPDALIPRRETEILGRAVLSKLKALANEGQPPRVMDMCTGSGNLALAYAAHEPTAQVHGSDISGDAIALARRNAAHLRLEERVKFSQGDMFAPFERGDVRKWDVLSCNPPYVTTVKVSKMHHEISRFEPEVAFNGGHFGISIVASLISNAPRFLKPRSWLAFEVGLGQGGFLVRLLRKNPAFREIETHADGDGNIRAILARSRPDS